MPTYTVHAPPPREGVGADPERFVFVRDGFHFWAFLLAPLWLLIRRQWLVLVLFVVANVALGVGLTLVDASTPVDFLGGLAVALFMGFEAATLVRWRLKRRGWQMLGFVVGEDREMAERRFYGEWVNRAPPPLFPAQPTYSMPVRPGAPSGADVIGLFPEPGAAP